MTFRDSEPRRRIALLWISALVLIAAGAALAAREEQVHRSQVLQEATAQADVLAGSVGGALAFDDKQVMDQSLSAVLRNPQVASAAIYKASGRLVAALSRSGSAPLPARVNGASTRQVRGREQMAREVTEQGQRLGFVYLETAPEPPSEIFGRHLGLIMLTGLAALLLTFASGVAVRLEHANARLNEEIKARAEAEEALRQSQKLEALGQLTGGIAHDFNNLLQAMHGAFELILRRPGDAKTTARWAQAGLEAANRGSALTRQLLAFSRRQKLELKPLIVADTIGAMRDLLARTLGPKIELVFDLNDDRVPVMADLTQLELAVMNLAVNARDAMPDGGRLTLRTRKVDVGRDAVLAPGRYLQLRVIDTGVGMPADVMQRAFDPFFTTKALGKGTGLGLAQVYGVARQAGGDARIANAPGGGVAVTLWLREAVGQPAATTPEAQAVTARPRQGATVLLVDDDEGVRDVVRGGLELHGFKVLDAESGEAALAMAGESPPQIAVIDYAMPGMDGAETAEHLRELIPQLPIILASGYADTAAIERAFGGAATVLRKPFDIEKLSETVAGLLATSAVARPAGGLSAR